MDLSAKKGAFIVSLDFELFWGMFDKVTLEEYGERIKGERMAVPRMLDLFAEYGIHATWATVGMLMARNRHELMTLLPPPHLRPVYEDISISSYHHIEHAHIGETEDDDPYHFAPTLVKKILETPHQEFANHTFSHYYCIDGHENDPKIFERDLEAHTVISTTYGAAPVSIVFPRNQTSEDALRTARERGIIAYRGNEEHFLYRPRKDSEQSLFIRGLRLLDHYVNLSGHHTYRVPHNVQMLPVNVPSSRFMRPWNRALQCFEPLRLRRIKSAMTHAARHGETYHLWWHPHNMGIDQTENFRNLEKILLHFRYLKDTYSMESLCMREVAERALKS